MAKSRSTKRSSKKGRGSNAARAGGSRRTSATKSRAGNGGGRGDAIALLKADHREVERLFAAFKSSRSEDRKGEIAERICAALRAHTTIEEEMFYPAFLEATAETEIHHEAEIEHEGAKRLIDEIESNGSGDDHFEARVSVLEEMIRHHVKEEEQRGGMFSKAQSSSMDLRGLGRQMSERKLELMGESSEGLDGGARRSPPPQGRSRRGERELRSR